MVDVPESLTLEERRVIDRWIEVLREEIDLESVWLFGSVARGERREDSDVDRAATGGRSPRCPRAGRTRRSESWDAR
jgi:predicted nucleotidyltransferase